MTRAAVLPRYRGIAAALAAHGLAARGGFALAAADRAPAVGAGRPARALILVGAAGPAPWTAFAASAEAADGAPDPLDRWSRRVIAAVAAACAPDGARVIGPGDGPPYPPFLAWARRAAAVHPSPLGLLIDPAVGLWHSYRGALALAAVPPDLPAPAATPPAPCASCADRPCLAACPVGAFSADGYAAETCRAFLADAAGQACRTAGCAARRACPVGADARYPPAQAAFHMAAFLGWGGDAAGRARPLRGKATAAQQGAPGPREGV